MDRDKDSDIIKESIETLPTHFKENLTWDILENEIFNLLEKADEIKMKKRKEIYKIFK